MKKVLKWFACAALLFVSSGCSSSKVDDAALDRLEAELKKFSEVESMDYTMGVDAPDSKVKAEIYGSFIAETKEISMAVDMEASGQKMEKFMEIYFKDNMMYVSAMGTQQKQEADMSAFDGIGLDPDTMQFDKKSLKNNLKEATIKDNTIHMVIKDDVLKEYVKKQGSSLSSMGVDEITEASIDMECGEDLMNSLTITLTRTDDGETKTFSVYVKFANVNQIKEIEYPNGLDDWPLAENSGFLE